MFFYGIRHIVNINKTLMKFKIIIETVIVCTTNILTTIENWFIANKNTSEMLLKIQGNLTESSPCQI